MKSNARATCGCGAWLGPAGPPGVVNDCTTSGVVGPCPAADALSFLPLGVSGCWLSDGRLLASMRPITAAPTLATAPAAVRRKPDPVATAGAEALAAGAAFSAVRRWLYPVKTDRNQRSEGRNRLPEGLGRGWRDPGSGRLGPHHPGSLKVASIEQFGQPRHPNCRVWRAPAPSMPELSWLCVDSSIGLPEPSWLCRASTGSVATLSPIDAELDIYMAHMRPA